MTNEEIIKIKAYLKAALRILGTEQKRNGGLASLAKAKQNGVKLGRKKKRDDAAIKMLRDAGLSIRAIATAQGVSTSAVKRSLKTTVLKGGEK